MGLPVSEHTSSEVVNRDFRAQDDGVVSRERYDEAVGVEIKRIKIASSETAFVVVSTTNRSVASVVRPKVLGAIREM